MIAAGFSAQWLSLAGAPCATPEQEQHARQRQTPQSFRLLTSSPEDVMHKWRACFTAHYPSEFPSRVTVRFKSGQSFSHEVSDYPGFPTRHSAAKTSAPSSTSSWQAMSARNCAGTSGTAGIPGNRLIVIWRPRVVTVDRRRRDPFDRDPFDDVFVAIAIFAISPCARWNLGDQFHSAMYCSTQDCRTR
jgi:hypothetical protein